MKVRFIRHGESLANAGGVTAEPDTIPLTRKGELQAQTISQTFGNAPDLIITSPYLRARHTAEPTLARFPHVPFEIWPVQEIEMLATERRMHTRPRERLPLIKAYWSKADPDYVDGDGAESYRDFIGRVRHALERLAKRSEHTDIAVFAHEQFMKGILLEIADPLHAIDGETMQAFNEFHRANRIANGDGFSIFWNGQQWRKLRSRDGFDANTGTG